MGREEGGEEIKVGELQSSGEQDRWGLRDTWGVAREVDGRETWGERKVGGARGAREVGDKSGGMRKVRGARKVGVVREVG